VAVCALWLPPLIVFLAQDSAWAVLPAALLAAFAVRVLDLAPMARPAGQRAACLFIAVLLEAGVVAAVVGRVGWAVLALIAATAAAAWLVLHSGAHARLHRGRALTQSRGVSALLTLAVLLTLAGLSRYLSPEALAIFSGGEDRGVFALFRGGGGSAARQTPSKGRASDRVTILDRSFPGIVLWPEVKSQVSLVAPLPAMGPGLSRMPQSSPLSIPFYGAYWFLRPPDTEPPPGATVMRGTADRQGFRTNDGHPLTMEARQNFGLMINTNCCREILLTLRNADHYPGTVKLEMRLRNTALPGRPEMVLGWAQVQSNTQYRFWSGRGIVVDEDVTFAMPLTPTLAQFDEMSVRFELARMREDRSARIAIERIVLVPKGAASR
jgi:hypothetical protein